MVDEAADELQVKDRDGPGNTVGVQDASVYERRCGGGDTCEVFQADCHGVGLADVRKVYPAFLVDLQATVLVDPFLQATGLTGGLGDDAGQVAPEPARVARAGGG